MLRARNLLEASKAMAAMAPVLGVGTRPESTNDLLRGAVVLGGSALDAYVHHIFSQRFVPYVTAHPSTMAPGQPLHRYLRSIGMPVASLKLPAPKKGKRPLGALRAAVDARLFRTSLQKIAVVGQALDAVGLPNTIRDLALASSLKETTLRSRISKVTNRRNAIAHEGDLFRGKKKRFVSRPITEVEVGIWLDRVDDFVTRLDAYVTANPP
jgi:hypothetical protein